MGRLEVWRRVVLGWRMRGLPGREGRKEGEFARFSFVLFPLPFFFVVREFTEVEDDT